MPRSRRPPLRQFQCDCSPRRWWVRVPRDDPVSECRNCYEEVDALPQEMESGWAKFECDCGNDFSGFATLINPADSPCYICGDSCTPVRVLRFSNTEKRKSSNTHSCTGVNCFNRVQDMPARGDCVHPKSHGRGNNADFD